jgi:hypothetical protein
MERTYLLIEIPPKKKATYNKPAHEIVKPGKISSATQYLNKKPYCPQERFGSGFTPDPGFS